MTGSGTTAHLPGRLVLVRHGESEWNATGRWQGHGGTGLSARGRAEAEATAARVARDFPDALVIARSDLPRVVETSAPLEALLGVPVRVDERLRELDCGAWSGLTHEQIAAVDPHVYAGWQRGEDVALGGGERVCELQERVVAALRDLLAEVRGGTAVVVTHGGPVRVGVPGLLGRRVLRLEDGERSVANCSVTVLTSTGERLRLDQYGDCTHLDGAGRRPVTQGPL